MENYIKCPNCGTTMTNNPIIDSAANGENLGSTSLNCECGERITFWAITAQLRSQKKPGARIMKWFRSFLKS